MATYTGVLVPALMDTYMSGTMTKNRANEYRLGVITNCGEGMTLVATMTKLRATRYRMGINLYNYNDIQFQRIPREHILNKFASLCGNIRF